MFFHTKSIHKFVYDKIKKFICNIRQVNYEILKIIEKIRMFYKQIYDDLDTEKNVYL